MLEVACATGHYLQKIRDNGFSGKYEGIDITPNLIKRAQEKHPQEIFKVMDAKNLEYRDDSFDTVMCCGLIMHLDEPAKALSEAFRVAKKRVLISSYYTKGTHRKVQHFDNFLNYAYTYEKIISWIPNGWLPTNIKAYQRGFFDMLFVLTEKK